MDVKISDIKIVKLNLIITSNCVQNSLVGRNWLDVISPDWKKALSSAFIPNTQRQTLQCVDNKFSSKGFVEKLKTNFPYIFLNRNDCDTVDDV